MNHFSCLSAKTVICIMPAQLLFSFIDLFLSHENRYWMRNISRYLMGHPFPMRNFCFFCHYLALLYEFRGTDKIPCRAWLSNHCLNCNIVLRSYKCVFIKFACSNKIWIAYMLVIEIIHALSSLINFESCCVTIM